MPIHGVERRRFREGTGAVSWVAFVVSGRGQAPWRTHPDTGGKPERCGGGDAGHLIAPPRALDIRARRRKDRLLRRCTRYGADSVETARRLNNKVGAIVPGI